MKKTIKILIEKMNAVNENKDGTLQGGYASIKGGMINTMEYGTNDWWGCTNTKDCSRSNNTGGHGCTNTGICFS